MDLDEREKWGISKQLTKIAEHMSQQNPSFPIDCPDTTGRAATLKWGLLENKKKNEIKNTLEITDIIQGHLIIFRCSVTDFWQTGLV